MRAIAFFAVLCLSLSPAFGQSFTLATDSTTVEAYYPYLDQVSSGPSVKDIPASDAEPETAHYRLVFTSVEENTNLYVEKIALGVEGIGRHVVWARKIPLIQLAGDLGRHGWVAIGKPVEWHSPASATVRTQGGPLRLEALDQKTVTVFPVE